MSAVVVASTEGMTRDEWLRARRSGLGGSDAAAIMGLSPYSSPMAVYLDKTGQLPLHEGSSEQARWGQRLEAAVAEGAIDTLNEDREKPLKIRRRNAILQHPDPSLSFVLANIDRQVTGHEAGPAVLEVKTVDKMAAARWEDGDLPERFVVQTMHYLGVTGWPHAFIAALIGGNQLRVERIERDDEMIAALWQVEEDFWRRVTDRRPPPADGTDATREAIAAVFPRHQPDTEVVLPVEARDLFLQRAAAKAAEDAAAERRKAIESALALMVGDAETVRIAGVEEPVATYKAQTRRSVDSKALREAHPAIAEEFSKLSTFRRWNVKRGVI